MPEQTFTFGQTDGIAAGDQTDYDMPGHLFGIENQIDMAPFRNLQVTGGIVWETERVAGRLPETDSGQPGMRVATKPNMVTDRLVSAYIQAQYKPFQSTAFTLGSRYDHSSSYGNVHTPRLALVYNRRKLTAKLLYMEAFRAPKPRDFMFGEGNPFLEPERMKSLEFSATYAPASRWETGLSLYRNVYGKILTGTESRWENSGGMRVLGFEASLKYEGKRIRPYANYTLNDSDFEVTLRDSSVSGAVPQIARHSVNVGFTFAFTSRLKLNLRGNYLGKRRDSAYGTDPNNDVIDPTFVMHGSLSVLNVRGFDFQLIGKNLLSTTGDVQPRRLMLNIGYQF